MAKPTQQSISGTSFHDVTITSTVNRLTEILGEPEQDYGDKTNYEWECETENGKPFTIYDWKEYRSIGRNELIEWHIGAFDVEQALNAKHELDKMLK